MAFLHSHSTECMKSELDLFTLPPTQTSIDHSQFVYYNPVSTLSDDAPIEFIVPGHGDEYIDLAHTMLKIKAKITKGDGSVTATTDHIGPVNNFLHSMFNQVDVYFNQKVVTPPNNLYAYRAYIETLLNYGSDAKNSHLEMSLWQNDTAEHMDSEANGSGAPRNAGLAYRRVFTDGSQIFDMLGHLHCDVFNQDKFLLNGVELRIRLIRAKDTFCLMDHSAHLCKVQVLEASLMVRRVKLSPGVLLGHAKTLAKTTAKYPLTRVEVKSFVLHSGILGETLDNVILGQLPKRIIIGFVENASFNGARKKNPFNFQNFGVNFLCLNVDGRQIPTKPLQPKYGTRQETAEVEAYHTIFNGTGIHYMDRGNGISRVSYADGYCLYAFDLTPDLSAGSAGHWNLVKTGSVRIEVRFDKATTVNVNCVVYGEYDNLLEIDSTRQVIVDYSG